MTPEEFKEIAKVLVNDPAVKSGAIWVPIEQRIKKCTQCGSFSPFLNWPICRLCGDKIEGVDVWPWGEVFPERKKNNKNR